jgi:hypothetical protein
VQLLNGLGVVAQILLTANQDNGEALAEVENLGNPLKRPRQHGSGNEEAGRLLLLERYSKFQGTNLLLDVVERIGRVDGETDQDNVGIGV